MDERDAQLATLSTTDIGRWLGIASIAARLGAVTPEIEVHTQRLRAELARREPDVGDPLPALQVARKIVAPGIRCWKFRLVSQEEYERTQTHDPHLDGSPRRSTGRPAATR